MVHYKKGEHKMGQICLPKPPQKLKYVSVDIIPGMLVPKDDEDFEDIG